MPTTVLRHPAVAGRFYPGDPDDLRAEARAYLSQVISTNQIPVRAVGCIAPHAGYMYSGHVAGAVFARMEIPERCIVLCPNHTGMGRALAIMSEGAWQTPLGDVPIDAELAGALKLRFPALQEDSAAHRAEHAAEVELPFLLLRQPELEVRPHRSGDRAIRGARTTRQSFGRRNRGAERSRSDRRFERYESLRVGRGDTGKGSPGDRAHSYAGSARTLRCGHATEHQHVRLWSGRGHADSGSTAGREVGGTGEVCDLGRYFRRPRDGCGLCRGCRLIIAFLYAGRRPLRKSHRCISRRVANAYLVRGRAALFRAA